MKNQEADAFRFGAKVVSHAAKASQSLRLLEYGLTLISSWVSFYKTNSGRSPIREYIDDLPKADQARFAEVFNEIEHHGLNAVGMIFKPLEGKLWEIKFQSTGGGFRILYVLPMRNTIVWLHAIHKKTQKTPRRDLQLALARMKEVLSS